VEHRVHKGAAPMRFTALLLAAPLLSTKSASACPDTVATDVSTDVSPSTSQPCSFGQIDFSRVHRVFEIGYSVGATATTQSGVGQVGSAFVGLDLGYGLQFGGDDEQPSYEVVFTAGAAGTRVGGDVAATGLVTKAGVQLGPAQMNASTLDTGRGNIAFFPLTMEIAHTGELGARPRLSARPELARKLYGRERVELETRIVRVEGAGEKAQTGAPGTTEPKKATSWAIDVLPLHSGVDIAMQDDTRFELTVGGALMGVEEHVTGAHLDLLGVEHRRIDLPMMGATDLDTVWMLRMDGTDPFTGSQYVLGWGEVVAMPDADKLREKLDPEGKTITIGGAGWFSQPRSWGGFGAQYKREPFVTMTGEVALEDRISAEVYIPRALGLTAKVFGARTTRLVGDELVHASTGGISLDASYSTEGFSSKLGLELGRTYYTDLDGALPETTGFGANLALTVQHAGGKAWRR